MSITTDPKHRKPAITVAFLWQKRGDTDKPYYTGKLGPTRVIVAPIQNPKPGHPEYVLRFAESDTTVTAEEASWLEQVR